MVNYKNKKGESKKESVCFFVFCGLPLSYLSVKKQPIPLLEWHLGERPYLLNFFYTRFG